MAPKKEGNKKPPAVIIDGIDTSPFSREKLEQFTIKVKEELDREREERNYFQLERDKIRIFWEITLEQLDEENAKLKNIERDSEITQEENDLIIKFERQKTKFLKYEQLGYLAALKTDNVVALQNALVEHGELEMELLYEKRTTKENMVAKLQAEADGLRRAKEKHADQLDKSKAEFEQEKAEIEDICIKKLMETKVELEVRHRTELAEVQERKNKQISVLIEQHEKSFAELRNYYNDITLNNLGLIASIKRQIEEMEEVKKKADKIFREALAEAKKLREPLELAILDNKELKRQMANYDRDKASLKGKRILLAKLQHQNEILKWEYEALESRFEKLRPMRDGIKARFTKAVLDVRDKMSGEITAMLETKFNSMQDKKMISQDLQDLLKYKDAQVEDLRYEAARIRKAHDDLLATYEAKLLKLGVPPDELGFKPLKAVVVAGLSPVIGQGPANLVTKNQ